MGIKTLPEVVNSTASKSVKLGFGSLGEKISDGMELAKNHLKDDIDHSKNMPSIKEWEECKWDDDTDDTSEDEFEQKRSEVAENSPGKTAVKDQDLADARKRGVGWRK